MPAPSPDVCPCPQEWTETWTRRRPWPPKVIFGWGGALGVPPTLGGGGADAAAASPQGSEKAEPRRSCPPRTPSSAALPHRLPPRPPGLAAAPSPAPPAHPAPRRTPVPPGTCWGRGAGLGVPGERGGRRGRGRGGGRTPPRALGGGSACAPSSPVLCSSANKGPCSSHRALLPVPSMPPPRQPPQMCAPPALPHTASDAKSLLWVQSTVWGEIWEKEVMQCTRVFLALALGQTRLHQGPPTAQCPHGAPHTATLPGSAASPGSFGCQEQFAPPQLPHPKNPFAPWLHPG